MTCKVTVTEASDDDPTKNVNDYRTHMYKCECGYVSLAMSFDMACQFGAYHEMYQYREMNHIPEEGKDNG